MVSNSIGDFLLGLPFGFIGEGRRSNSKTNGVPSLLHVENKKSN